MLKFYQISAIPRTISGPFWSLRTVKISLQIQHSHYKKIYNQNPTSLITNIWWLKRVFVSMWVGDMSFSNHLQDSSSNCLSCYQKAPCWLPPIHANALNEHNLI